MQAKANSSDRTMPPERLYFLEEVRHANQLMGSGVLLIALQKPRSSFLEIPTQAGILGGHTCMTGPSV